MSDKEKRDLAEYLKDYRKLIQLHMDETGYHMLICIRDEIDKAIEDLVVNCK